MDYKCYDCSLKNIKKTLDIYGVAVIPNIFSQNECDTYIKGIWKELNEITSEMDKPLKLKNKTTWKTLY